MEGRVQEEAEPTLAAARGYGGALYAPPLGSGRSPRNQRIISKEINDFFNSHVHICMYIRNE